MGLTSTLFTKPQRNPRLDRCLTEDAAHIQLLPSREKGEHVTRIQLALLSILRKVDFGGEAIAREYGPKTAALVLQFKKERNILNTALRQTVPDSIVGKKTIAALDQEMARKQLPPGRLPRLPVGAAPLRKMGFTGNDVVPGFSGVNLSDVLGLVSGIVPVDVDVFVFFQGTDPAREGQQNTAADAEFIKKFNTPAYLLTHLPAVPFCFMGGRDATDRSKQVAADVQKLRGITKTGVTVIVGSSVGALPAINCAKLLTAAGVKLDYVAINDGAFFAARNEVSFPFKVTVGSASIAATRKDNFFQTFGHELLTDSRGAGGFMDGTEFHGPLDGFTNNIDLAGKPGPQLQAAMANSQPSKLLPNVTPGRLKLLKFHADRIHQAAADQAEPVIDQEVAKFIKP